jgi:UDP-N-acetylmuramate dehydrogenase
MDLIRPTNEQEELLRCLDVSGLTIQTAHPLAPLTTSLTGGKARFFMEINTINELSHALRLAAKSGISCKLLGNGSNVLVPDAGLDGCVIKLGRGFRWVDCPEAGVFTVGASMPLMTLARQCSGDGWSGLEFAGGIPASMGGAIKMNAGAHGGDCSGVVEAVEVVSESNNWEPVWLEARELSFSYRHSSICSNSVVVKARLRLTSSSADQCASNLAKNLNFRKSSQPLRFPSFGSVFKNPDSQALVGLRSSTPENLPKSASAAWLIESVGLKGQRIGGAMISDMHANWIVNTHRRATTGDMIALIALAKKKVFQHYGVTLKEEVDYWGEDLSEQCDDKSICSG